MHVDLDIFPHVNTGTVNFRKFPVVLVVIFSKVLLNVIQTGDKLEVKPVTLMLLRGIALT